MNYIKTAWGSLSKNKTQAWINIAGLSVGMTVAILIGLWIWDELSFNRYYTHYDQIAQIARKEIQNGETYIGADNNHMPIPLAAELKAKYGNYFKEVMIATSPEPHMLSFDNNRFSKTGMYVDSGFTNIFTLHMLSGSAKGMRAPNTILLTKSLAVSLFGNGEALGKMLKLDNNQNVQVAGVFDNLPDNAQFSDVSFLCPWDLLLSSNTYIKNLLADWGNSSFQIYVESAPGVSMTNTSAVIKKLYWSKVEGNVPKGSNFTVDLFLYPMKDWHLRSEWKNGVQAGGRIEQVWLFGIIGVVVLLLACINFMNLSTARSGKKAREIGVRKTIGSLRGQLINQFLVESFLVVLIAFGLSIVLVASCLNAFNQVAAKNLSLPFNNPVFWILSLFFIVVTALLAGTYPALYLSSFQPIKVLRGTFRCGNLSTLPRKIMVTIQFSVSITLIISTIVVYRQIRHAQDRPIGYNKTGLISSKMVSSDLQGKYDVIQKELLQSGGATSFAQSSSPTTDIGDFDDRFEWLEKDPHFHTMSFGLIAVSYDFGKTVGWQFTQGRDFSRSFSTDEAGLILNEAAVKYMHLTHPIGEQVKFQGKSFSIIGVIKDMINQSPYTPVKQNIFLLVPPVGPFMTIRLNPELGAGEALSRIESVFKRLDPANPFEFTFVSEDYGHKFAAEQSISTLAIIFSALAIFISCLGIFGLAGYVAERRTKEISIRKVLGASVFHLWALLSLEFLILVAIALLIAIPVGFIFMDHWLQKYDYRTSVNWWIFAVAGCGALAITLITSSYQSIKTALINPATSLRSE